jgi:plastocyanin
MKTAFLMAAVALVSGCGSDNPSSPPVLTVVLTAPKQTIAVGDPLQLTATARDVNGVTVPGATISYASSASNVARVSPSGLLVGLAPGSASITAASAGTISDAVTVTVTAGSVAGVFATQATSFAPTQITIKVQQSVAFAFLDGTPHNVAFRDRAQRPGVPTDVPTTTNEVVSRTFATTGTFPFDCTLHSGMTGQVIVNP